MPRRSVLVLAIVLTLLACGLLTTTFTADFVDLCSTDPAAAACGDNPF